MPSSETPPVASRSQLGVPGLGDPLSLLAPGEIYAIVSDGLPPRLALVAQALRATLEQGTACTAILPGDPPAFVSKARLAGVDLGWFEKNGELRLVRQRPDPLLPLFRAGPAAVLELIDRSVPDGCGLLVIEQAEPLLFLSDPGQAAEAADALRAWARRRAITVLATFAPATRPQREWLSLRAAADDFAGFAVIREHEGGAVLDVRHWFGAEGSNARGSVTLATVGRGTLAAAPSEAPATPARARDGGTPQVVALENALDDPLGAVRDAGWSLVRHPAEAIETARRLSAGAIVLSFDRATPMRALCQTVSAVRRVAAPWVAIVVRERGMRLRLAQQVALVRLGASSVVPQSCDDADVAQAVRALSGTAFMRVIVDDVEAALAAAGTTTAPQLMVTRAFRDTVAEVLSASEGLELPHALLHVACDPARAQQLGTFALQRKLRDAVMSVDPSGLWVFLYGCPASRAPSVAERAFGRYHPEVVDAISVEGTTGGIARRLERLAPAVGLRESDPVRATPTARPA
jgi:hypothetical protein